MSADGPPPLDLSDRPPFYIFRTHLSDDQAYEIERALDRAHARLTYNAHEARIFLSKAVQERRILYDFRGADFAVEKVQAADLDAIVGKYETVVRDRRENNEKEQDSQTIRDDDSTESELDVEVKAKKPQSQVSSSGRKGTGKVSDQHAAAAQDTIIVVRMDWLTMSTEANTALPLQSFTSFVGKPLHSSEAKSTAAKRKDKKNDPNNISVPGEATVLEPETSVLKRAQEDADQGQHISDRSIKRRFDGKRPQQLKASEASWAPGHVPYAHLLHATTSEEGPGASSDLPEAPDWVKKGIKYACQRVTLAGNPNEEFISLLRKIKLTRLLTSDEIGVRAYSTSIAAMLAYPYKFVSPKEILRLPGCDAKIANLFVEWANTGRIKAVDDLEADRDLTILRLFYDIWGVGAQTAREFFYDHGWQDLDDLVDYNWKGLTRVQQIGVKYYEQFLEKIPRPEVSRIGRLVHQHAVKVRDTDIQSIIVGGYRRGKSESGDVDIIISHPDESKTLNIISDIVDSLETGGWITHTLLLSLNATHRDQQTLPYRSGHGGHGFDTLDKALVVWQDPDWPMKDADIIANPNCKNPNIHRRVDIIIAPWRTVGCAVLGWSGGTTFQRDVRRYVKHTRGWKFDSSGGRDRANGQVLDLEGYHRYDGRIGTGRAKTMEQAEKRVFEALGLEYREPSERVTD